MTLHVEVVNSPPGTAADVAVRVQNTSAVPLVDVVISGKPSGCRRTFDRMEPGQRVAYRCSVPYGSAAELAASARLVLDGEVTDVVRTVRATGRVEVPVAGPVAPPSDPPVADRPGAPDDEPMAQGGGPLDAPERTAGFIAILGVLVMMVSVGALSSATRPK